MTRLQTSLTKVAYTPNECIALGIAGSRTSLYRFVKEGKLRMTKRGRNSIFMAKDVSDFLASLPSGTSLHPHQSA